ncbi:MAG: OmpA family protein [Mucinivorans sp.]
MKTSYLLYTFVVLACMSLIFSSCVSTRTYRSTKAELLGYQNGWASMRDTVDKYKQLNTRLQAQLDSATADDRFAELQDLLAQREAALMEIRSLIDDALESFNGQGFTITERDGKIYVSMDEKLLFESGKSNVSAQGRRAIGQIAGVLERNPNVEITIEGHTDNKGYMAKKGAQIVDNWDLSAHRATEVVRIMLSRSNINPSRVTASGRGEFCPVAPNNSDSQRAQNRRTEIILTPNMDRLMELLK